MSNQRIKDAAHHILETYKDHLSMNVETLDAFIRDYPETPVFARFKVDYLSMCEALKAVAQTGVISLPQKHAIQQGAEVALGVFHLNRKSELEYKSDAEELTGMIKQVLTQPDAVAKAGGQELDITTLQALLRSYEESLQESQHQAQHFVNFMIDLHRFAKNASFSLFSSEEHNR